MATSMGLFKLPEHFEIEAELREQFSNRSGHQRCVEGRDEVMLVVHEVPTPGIAEREAVFFWKRGDGRWMQPGGAGLNELGELLDRYAQALDEHEARIDEADTAAEIFAILRHSGPLARALREMVQALEQALAVEHEDRRIRTCRDRARELERAAELLHADARVTLEFWQAQRSEQISRASLRLGRLAFQTNLLVGFFLPLIAFGSWFGRPVQIPGSVQPWCWGILLAGAATGTLLLWLAGRQTDSRVDCKKMPGND
ncbi:MAG: hypothetical protein NTW21_33495 [Verrucomicrobia bacterium]|nr:hypothetical protein [Verrucomicrobiota bacterium]